MSDFNLDDIISQEENEPQISNKKKYLIFAGV